MKVYIGVSRRLEFLTDAPGDENFWCFKPNQQVAKGDLLLLYFPMIVSTTKHGIRQIYRVVSPPSLITSEIECSRRNMATVKTQLLATLVHGITLHDLRRHDILKDLYAVRRNMQGTAFEVEPELWPDLRHVMMTANDLADIV